MSAKIHYLKTHELIQQFDQHREISFFAVIDHKVKNHLPQWIQFSPGVYWLSNPELQKNLETYEKIAEFFVEQGIERKSVVYAIGGGATSDLAGFVAATLLRGVKWRVIPTTLLSMVDAAIGGKVAVNLPHGKNLLGSFYHPEDILLSVDFLKTCSESDRLSGEGEIIKYGFLSAQINDMILSQKPLEDLILACAQFKADVVNRDFKEEGERMHLNLGHTFGHAFEHLWKIPHGQAVLMGLKALFMVFNQPDSVKILGDFTRARGVDESYLDFAQYPQLSLDEFLKTLYADKKKQNSKLRFILAKRPGNCVIEDVTHSELRKLCDANEAFQNIFRKT